MEYVILIIVIAVLALGTGGWLLFVRPRRGRTLEAPRTQTPVPPATETATQTGTEPGSADAESTTAPDTAAAATGVLEVERPPPSAGRLIRLRARLARSQSSLGSALLGLLSRDRLDEDRKSTRLNSSHLTASRMPSSA